MSQPGTLVAQIADTEERLKTLRAQRDAQILESYAAGTSKYRLAKDWHVTENTITRIVTGTKPGSTPKS